MGIAIAGVLAETISGVVGIAALLTALLAATWRYTAVLRGGSHETVDRATARGFFVGLAISALIVFVDQLWA